MARQKVVRVKIEGKPSGTAYDVPDGWRVVSMQMADYMICWIVIEEIGPPPQIGPYREGA